MSSSGENIQEWAKALRDGQYKQGVGALKKVFDEGESYCPWGVACDIYRTHNPDNSRWKSWVNPVSNSSVFYLKDSDGEEYNCNMIPPKEVVNFFGCSHEDMNEIIDMNDQLRYTFNDIANFVEKGERIHEYETES